MNVMAPVDRTLTPNPGSLASQTLYSLARASRPSTRLFVIVWFLMSASESPRGSTGETRRRQLLMANAKTDLKMKARNCALAGSCYPLMVDAVGDDEFLVLQV